MQRQGKKDSGHAKKIVDMQKASAMLPHINKCLEPFSVF